MEELLSQYAEKFHENFPLFSMMGMEDEEIESILKKCLTEGNPYSPPDLENRAVY